MGQLVLHDELLRESLHSSNSKTLNNERYSIVYRRYFSSQLKMKIHADLSSFDIFTCGPAVGMSKTSDSICHPSFW